MISARTAVWAAILFSAWGCRSEPPAAAPVNPPPGPSASAAIPKMAPQSMADTVCPMQVNGTTLSFSDVPDGIEVKFTTNAIGNIAELRSRVNRMAIMHASRAAGGRAAGGGVESLGSGADTTPQGAGMPPMHGREQGVLPLGSPVPSTATVRDLPNGASLTINPRDSTQVSGLREQVRAHAIQMQQTGQCPRAKQ